MHTAKIIPFVYTPKNRLLQYFTAFKRIYLEKGHNAAYAYIRDNVPEQLWPSLNKDINIFVNQQKKKGSTNGIN